MAIPQNQNELLALEKFRAVTQDLEFGDGVLMRFLRARNLDQNKAEDMIRKFVIWRVESEINKFHNWTCPRELYVYESFFTGFDDDGRVVLWCPFGQWPYVRDALDKGLHNDILLWAGKMCDQMYKLLLKTKHQQAVVIVDTDGLTFSKVFYEARNWKGFQTLFRLISDYEANFPEVLHKAFLINTPSAFMWAWKFIQPFVSEYTLSKANFYGANDSETEAWKSDLFHHLPARVLPQKYGGSATKLIRITDDNPDYMKLINQP